MSVNYASHASCIRSRHFQSFKAKYQYRKFLDKSALVASKLGPSKTVSSVGKAPASPSPERSKTPASTSSEQAVTATSTAASSIIPTRRPIASPSHAALAKANSPGCPLGLDNMLTPNPGQTTSSSSVWKDLSSLAVPGQDSSLPLQYQVSHSVEQQPPAAHGPMAGMGYPVGVTSTGMGMNPFQAHTGFASQQQMLSPFTTPFSATPSVSTVFNAQSQQPFGQMWGTASPQAATPQSSFFHPQPQFPSQIQAMHGQGILSHSPNQQLLSAPVTQTQFLTPSPSQQLRYSPQMQTTMPGFLSQNPQVNMGLGTNPTGIAPLGQASFLGTTTMQMQQQQQMMLQQQAMLNAGQMPMSASGMGPGGNVFGQAYNQWGQM